MPNRLTDLFSIKHYPPAPTNGNGRSVVPAESKLRDTIQLAPGDFWPLDARGNVFEVDALTTDWYRVHWLVYACMRVRAIKFIEAPLWIAEEKDGEESWFEGEHELAGLLERPNPDMEMSDLLYATSVLLDTTGECLWIKNQDRANRVASLYPFGGDQFEVERSDERLYARFKVTLADGQQRTYDAEEVIYFREYAAVGPLEALASRLGIDAELLTSIRSAVRNSVMPGYSLRFPPGTQDMTPEQKDEFRNTVLPSFEGARNRGKLFISGNAELVQHQMTFMGLEGGELSKETEAAICAAFQVPPAIVGAYVGLENSSDRANMETAERYFYDLAIRPRWSWVQKVLTRSLLRPVDDNPLRFLRFVTDKIAALQEDQLEKAEIAVKAEGIATLDERRALLGLPPATDEQREELEPEPAPNPFGSIGDPPAEEPDEEEEKATKVSEGKAHLDPRQMAWALYHATAEAQEIGWTIAMSHHLAEDRALILGIIENAKGAAVPSETKDPPPFGPADAEFVRKIVEQVNEAMEERAKVLRDTVTPLLTATGTQAVQRTASRLGLSFDLLQPGLTRYVEAHSAAMVTQVTETTKEAVRNALSRGLIEGESIPDLTKRIQESGAFARSRAELIARTETTAATNEASVKSLLEYQEKHGGKFTKEWLTARDSRVRDEHAELDGEKVGIDEPFSNGLFAPGEPNCRCTLLETMED